MIDYHVHSTYSFDGKSPPLSYIHSAEECGLTEIGFAEHLDLDPDLPGYNFLDYPRYYKALEELQEHTSILIRCGTEISYQPHLEESIKDCLSKIECDFIIGSIHEVDGMTMDHTFFQQFSPQQYFEAVKPLITSGVCDIVGHLEYFKRWGGSYSSLKFTDEISSLLQLAIDNNVVLEVNTSGLRHPARSTYPSFEVIQLYKNLGGELISLGSDAHQAEHTAFCFPHLLRQLKSAGFSGLVTFNKRSMDFVDIP